MTRTDPDDVTLIGHRGCAGQHPENTVAAVERAAPHVDAVEVDVRRCASGELVVFHDAELDRLTGASGRVADTDWSDLRELTVLDSGEPIPRLEELFDAAPDDLLVNVEVKHPGVASDALDDARRARNDVLFSSFHPEALAALRDRDPGTDRALLVADGTPEAAVETATDLGCVAVHPPIDLATEPGFVATAHEAGLAVNAWTAADRDDAGRLLAAGVDGVIADRRDLLPERSSRD
ncbi:glycerophosphodiester phosphodiesterase [Halorubrum distributum]|uniref:Glycerophosphodiester phosphodiesterase n=1 Tax=Halorubrum distributum TaxID=29283 RepID=A0A6B1IGS7_9EURY|nr:glycerophosphodiester phosphodiesterase [Halorubrum terrestre]MYL15120.1 glycerophosphodiester phosphodiesterase [Halorubrum terrestre]MYL68862.1 glycerophosphodiester phosphodiesterase [Halorubrum terrestre]